MAVGVAACDEVAITEQLGCAEQALVIGAEHRDGPWPAPAENNEHAARATHDVDAAHVTELAPDKTSSHPEADQRRGARPAKLGRLGVAEGEVGGDLGGRVGRGELGRREQQRLRARGAWRSGVLGYSERASAPSRARGLAALRR